MRNADATAFISEGMMGTLGDMGDDFIECKGETKGDNVLFCVGFVDETNGCGEMDVDVTEHAVGDLGECLDGDFAECSDGDFGECSDGDFGEFLDGDFGE